MKNSISVLDHGCGMLNEFSLLSSHRRFFCRVILKFDGWPWKTIGHLFYATSSFVHHFIAISKSILELQSGNAQFWSKSMMFYPVKFDRWPWDAIGHLFYATSRLLRHFVTTGWFKLELQSGNAQFGSKSTIFWSRVTLKFDGWPWKTKRHPFYATSSFVHHFITTNEFKVELQSGNAQFGSKSAIFFSRVTLKFNGSCKTIEHFSKAASSFVHHFIIICEFKLESRSGNG